MSETAQDGFEIRRQLLQMEMLYEIGVALNESLDLSYVAQEILNRALVMVDARSGVLLVKEQEEGPVAVLAQVGLGELQPILQLEEIDAAWRAKELVHKEREAPAWRYLCLVPLASRGEVRGLLVVADKEHRGGQIGFFGESDEKLLRSFAYQAGAALQNARLHRHLQEAYAQLQAAQKKLAQLEQLRALGDLAAELTHELSHVLTTIIGRADVYLNFPRQPEKAMQAILTTAQGGVELIDKIRRFTRLSAGRKREAVDLNALIREAVEEVGLIWRQRGSADGIDWQVELSPLPHVQVNANDVKEVVTNLLLNALEAMPEGGTLRVHSRQEGDQVRVEVRDTGVGIPPDEQRRIFDPFYTTKEALGSGLGLSIAYRILDEHGGEIAVDSAAGQGSCFTFSLPVRGTAAAGDDGNVEAYFDRR